MAESSAEREQSFAIEIVSASRLPQAEFRGKVKAALDEATQEFKARHQVEVKVEANADGGLFGLGVAWPWVIHIGGEVLAHLIYDAGKEAAKEAVRDRKGEWR
jgi:hypothetical protein